MNPSDQLDYFAEGSPGQYSSVGAADFWSDDAGSSNAACIFEARHRIATLYYKRKTGIGLPTVGRRSNESWMKEAQCQVLAKAYASDPSEVPIDEWFRGPVAAAVFAENKWSVPRELADPEGARYHAERIVDYTFSCPDSGALRAPEDTRDRRAAALFFFKNAFGIAMLEYEHASPEACTMIQHATELADAYDLSSTTLPVDVWYRALVGACGPDAQNPVILQDLLADDAHAHLDTGAAGLAARPAARASLPSTGSGAHVLSRRGDGAGTGAPSEYPTAAATHAAAQRSRPAGVPLPARAARLPAEPRAFTAGADIVLDTGIGYEGPHTQQYAAQTQHLKRPFLNPLLRAIYTSTFHRWDDEGNHIGWLGIREWRKAIVDLIGEDVPLSTSYAWRKAEQEAFEKDPFEDGIEAPAPWRKRPHMKSLLAMMHLPADATSPQHAAAAMHSATDGSAKAAAEDDQRSALTGSHDNAAGGGALADSRELDLAAKAARSPDRPVNEQLLQQYIFQQQVFAQQQRTLQEQQTQQQLELQLQQQLQERQQSRMLLEQGPRQLPAAGGAGGATAGALYGHDLGEYTDGIYTDNALDDASPPSHQSPFIRKKQSPGAGPTLADTAAFHKWTEDGRHDGWMKVPQWRALILSTTGRDISHSTAYRWFRAEKAAFERDPTLDGLDGTHVPWRRRPDIGFLSYTDGSSTTGGFSAGDKRRR